MLARNSSLFKASSESYTAASNAASTTTTTSLSKSFLEAAANLAPGGCSPGVATRSFHSESNCSVVTLLSEENYPLKRLSSMSSQGTQNSSSNASPNTSTKLSTQFHKTRLCPFYARGHCRKGADCTYAHDKRELKTAPDLYKTKLCEEWQQGNCNDSNCRFAHGRQELRFTDRIYKTRLCHFFVTGDCNKGKLCRHAHGYHELRNEEGDLLQRQQPPYDPSHSSIISSPPQHPSDFMSVGSSNVPTYPLGFSSKQSSFESQRSAPLLHRGHSYQRGTRAQWRAAQSMDETSTMINNSMTGTGYGERIPHRMPRPLTTDGDLKAKRFEEGEHGQNCSKVSNIDHNSNGRQCLGDYRSGTPILEGSTLDGAGDEKGHHNNFNSAACGNANHGVRNLWYTPPLSATSSECAVQLSSPLLQSMNLDGNGKSLDKGSNPTSVMRPISPCDIVSSIESSDSDAGSQSVTDRSIALSMLKHALRALNLKGDAALQANTLQQLVTSAALTSSHAPPSSSISSDGLQTPPPLTRATNLTTEFVDTLTPMKFVNHPHQHHHYFTAPQQSKDSHVPSFASCNSVAWIQDGSQDFEDNLPYNRAASMPERLDTMGQELDNHMDKYNGAPFIPTTPPRKMMPGDQSPVKSASQQKQRRRQNYDDKSFHHQHVSHRNHTLTHNDHPNKNHVISPASLRAITRTQKPSSKPSSSSHLGNAAVQSPELPSTTTNLNIDASTLSSVIQQFMLDHQHQSSATPLLYPSASPQLDSQPSGQSLLSRFSDSSSTTPAMTSWSSTSDLEHSQQPSHYQNNSSQNTKQPQITCPSVSMGIPNTYRKTNDDKRIHYPTVKHLSLDTESRPSPPTSPTAAPPTNWDQILSQLLMQTHAATTTN